MSTRLYLASAESGSGKSAVALGLLDQLTRHGGRVGVFRPIVMSADQDPLLQLLLPRSSSSLDAAASTGVTYEQVHAGVDEALGAVVDRFHVVADEHDTVLVVGSDYTDVPGPTEFSVNASIAANIGASMLLVVPAVDRSPAEVATAAELTAHEARLRHAQVGAVIANRVDPDHLEPTSRALAAQLPGTPAYALPDDPVLKAPTVRDLMAACGGSLLLGDDELLDREAMALIVAGMTMPHVLDRLVEGGVVICPSDREEVLLASLLAHRSSTFPSLAGVILNGGFPLTGCWSTATARSTPPPPPSSWPTSRSPPRRQPSSSGSSRGWRCCPTPRAGPAPAPTSTRCGRRPSWCGSGRRGCRWRGRSSTTRPSTPPSPRPSSRAPPWPVRRRC